MQLRWYLARLQRMSPQEIAWRGRQTLRARIAAFSPGTNDLPDRAAAVRKDLPPLTRPWRISWFSMTLEWQGADISWQGDTLQNDSLTNLHWSKINYRDTAMFGDPKNTWELSRHQFLRQWVLNEQISVQERVNAVSHLALHWIEKNPYDRGMNWCSSLELALRLVSWQSCLAALGKDNFDPRVLNVIQGSAIEHCQHLRRHPSFYSSANNHRVGELLGEMAAAVMFPGDASLLSSAARAWDDMKIEARLQVTKDGICREQAFYYHAYTMLYFQRSASYAETLSFSVPSWFIDLTHKMQEALNAATDDKGNWFEIGDRDDGDLAALLPFDEESQLQPISAPAKAGFICYKEGGYAIGKTEDYHMLFRCGEFGYPSIAAHAHCDQLSVLLKINDRDILTDSGTGSYHDNEIWRRYFRGTTSHNTVRVNGEDQAVYGGPFLWNTAPAGVITEAESSHGHPAREQRKVIGSTRAWCRGPAPVVHQRTIEFDAEATEMLRVQDDLIPEKNQDTPRCYELIWNFGPGVTLKTDDDSKKEADQFNFRLRLDEKLFMRMTIHVSARSSWVIYYGDESIPAGFYSRQFGQITPITQLRIRCSSPAWQATTSFSRTELN